MKKINFLAIIFLIILLFSGCTPSKNYLKSTNNFAVESAKKGYWEEAKFRWQKIIEENPDDFVALNNLGVCYEVEGDYDTAIALYSKALELQPKNKYIKINLEKVKSVKEEKEKKGGYIIINETEDGSK